MKNQVACICLLLFIAGVISASAQPQCNEAFNPFYLCRSNLDHADYFFYGEIVAIERLKDGSLINSSAALFKMNVKVKKTFKGKTSNEITLYAGYSFICNDLAGNNSYLFKVVNGDLNGQPVYLVEQVSRPMTTYSTEAIQEVFAKIESVLGDKKENIVEGAIFEWLLKVRKVSLKPEDADRLSVDIENRQELADVTINAIDEKNGKVYQARSKTDGTFKINNIPPGKYKIKLNLPMVKSKQSHSITKQTVHHVRENGSFM